MLSLYLSFLSKKTVMHISVYLAWEFPLASTEGVLSALGTVFFKAFKGAVSSCFLFSFRHRKQNLQYEHYLYPTL